MYQLFVEEHFDAAHYLPNYHGKCERLHGHRFKVVARFGATKLDGPSSENIAAIIYDALQVHFSKSPVKLVSVEVWESPTAGVAYTP